MTFTSVIIFLYSGLVVYSIMGFFRALSAEAGNLNSNQFSTKLLPPPQGHLLAVPEKPRPSA